MAISRLGRGWWRVIAGAAIVAGGAGGGCSSRSEYLRTKYQLDSVAMADRAGAAMSPPVAQTVQLASADKDLSQVPMDRRVVVYTAGFEIVVSDVSESLKAAERIAGDMGGYVQKVDGDRISIRVPVAKYETAIAEVERLGRVTRREVEALDVTEEYVDLKARLKNALAVKARLDALLAKAEDTKAALEIEKELKRVSEEIEQLQAKLELINNRVALSTITILFQRVAPAGPDPRVARLPFAWLQQLDPHRLWQ